MYCARKQRVSFLEGHLIVRSWATNHSISLDEILAYTAGSAGSQGGVMTATGNAAPVVIAKTGENCQIRRFARFVLGEGLEKKQENLAEEIAKVAAAATKG